MSKPTYWDQLKVHPGVSSASLLTFFGIITSLEKGMWQPAAVMSVFWIPVLITARTQPVGGEDE